MPGKERLRRKISVGVDYWRNLLPNLRDTISDIVIETNRIRELLPKYSNEILLYNNDWERYKVELEEIRNMRENTPFLGVDSSLTPPQRLGPFLVSAVSAVAIITEGAYKNPQKYLEVRMARAPELADARYAVDEIKLEMFKLEAKKLGDGISALQRHFGKGITLVDGPIVDPPKFPRRSASLREFYEDEYVKSKCRRILAGLAQNLTIIGVVKKVRGNFLALYLQNQVGILKNLPVNDYTLVTLMFKSKHLRQVLIENLKSSEDMILATKPLELPVDTTDYNVYKKHGLYVYYLYILPGLREMRRRVLRIELAFRYSPSEKELEKTAWFAAKYVTAAILPGHNLPSPIILAHKACTIPRSTAKVLIREIMSGYLTEVCRRYVDLGSAIDLAINLLD